MADFTERFPQGCEFSQPDFPVRYRTESPRGSTQEDLVRLTSRFGNATWLPDRNRIQKYTSLLRFRILLPGFSLGTPCGILLGNPLGQLGRGSPEEILSGYRDPLGALRGICCRVHQVKFRERTPPVAAWFPQVDLEVILRTKERDPLVSTVCR